MRITQETRRESLAQLEPNSRKAAILAELERGDGTALEIMRRMGFQEPNAVRPRLNELDRAGLIFQAGKRKDPVTGIKGVIYSKKSPVSAGTENRWHRKEVRSCRVDGKQIKANTFYQLSEGKLVEADG